VCDDGCGANGYGIVCQFVIMELFSDSQYLALKLLCYCNMCFTMSLARDPLQAGTMDDWVDVWVV
jgi:hypothetical protein